MYTLWCRVGDKETKVVIIIVKNDLPSMSMRWRVDKQAEAQFRGDLARQGLKVQGLMETLMHAFIALPEEVKLELSQRLGDDGAEVAGRWLSDTVAAGQWLNRRISNDTASNTSSDTARNHAGAGDPSSAEESASGEDQ